MEDIVLNETPIRTSKNFNINNIKVDNINIPKRNMKTSNLTYGVGNSITELEPTTTININSDKQIELSINENNPVLIDHINIVAEHDLNILIKYTSDKYTNGFHSSIIKLNAMENTNVNITIINFLNNLSNNFLSIENDLLFNSKVNYTIIDFGGNKSITNYYSNIEGDNCQNNVSTIYIGNDNQLLDINYIGHLKGKNTNINMEIEGALLDNSKKHFKGTIDFKKGCKKAKGNENDSCMLLSNTAKSISLPILLCSEEDVEGSHSSSSGKIGEKELFYIMSRGFNLKEARKLMVKARFNNVLENIKDEKLKNEIIEKIDERII